MYHLLLPYRFLNGQKTRPSNFAKKLRKFLQQWKVKFKVNILTDGYLFSHKYSYFLPCTILILMIIIVHPPLHHIKIMCNHTNVRMYNENRLVNIKSLKMVYLKIVKD